MRLIIRDYDPNIRLNVVLIARQLRGPGLKEAIDLVNANHPIVIEVNKDFDNWSAMVNIVKDSLVKMLDRGQHIVFEWQEE